MVLAGATVGTTTGDTETTGALRTGLLSCTTSGREGTFTASTWGTTERRSTSLVPCCKTSRVADVTGASVCASTVGRCGCWGTSCTCEIKACCCNTSFNTQVPHKVLRIGLTAPRDSGTCTVRYNDLSSTSRSWRSDTTKWSFSNSLTLPLNLTSCTGCGVGVGATLVIDGCIGTWLTGVWARSCFGMASYQYVNPNANLKVYQN